MSDSLPYSYERDWLAAELAAEFAGLEPGSETDREASVAGRLMLIRRHGGLAFATLRDRSGEIQLMVTREEIGEQRFERFNELGMGDWVGARGVVVTTRRGELSVRVGEWTLLGPTRRQIPKEVHSPADPDLRYRERHLDLMLNADARRVFAIRSAAIAALRAELSERGFTEVETPVLGPSAGGAAARPFITHHNALDIDMYMRIALELPLKKLIVGGMERVYEIGRVFRNEGLDRRHNPEFTMLEAYQAFTDYEGMMELTQALIVRAAREATGSAEVETEAGVIDLTGQWRRLTMADLIAERLGPEMHPSMPVEDARRIAAEHGVEADPAWGSGKLMVEVYETVELELQEPTFVCDHPLEVSPLARNHREDPDLVERFELVIGGRELANAYSELIDPDEQRRRFAAEAAKRAAGDEEANPPDEDFVKALEHGMPPTGGLGIGVDRLVMLLSGAPSIREAILFPTLRPRGEDGGEAEGPRAG